MPTRKSKLKHATVVGVFATRSEAEAALRDLRAAGFEDDRIGLVGRNAAGKMVDEHGETYADEGAVAGAVAGAGVGALVGLGVLSGVIPVIGPALAAGTLGVILTNAAGGAAVIGLTGALIGWGIPEDEASYYESEVKAGRWLVTVDAKHGRKDRTDEARAIIRRHGGYDKATATAKPAGVASGMAVDAKADTSATEKKVQLKEERLRTRKEDVKAGEVKVRKEVITRNEQITVPVEREEVVIERRPAGGRRAGSADMKAEEIRIPVKEERVHVEKEPVVTEEVTVSKRKVRGTKTVGGTVRKEELKVEEEGDVEVKGDTSRR